MKSTGRAPPRERANTYQASGKGAALKKTMPAISKEPSKISGGFGDSMFDAEREPSESQGQTSFNQERSQDLSHTFGDESSLNGPRDDSNYS